MTKTNTGTITSLLNEWKLGDHQAFDLLIERVYTKLCTIASAQLKQEYRKSEFETREIVHEAYQSLAGKMDLDWQDRQHFFNVAAISIRRVLARQGARAKRQKRGEGLNPFTFDESVDGFSTDFSINDLLDLNHAFDALAAEDPDSAKVADLRLVIGLSVEETADMLNISTATVKRKFAFARAYLFAVLKKKINV